MHSKLILILVLILITYCLAAKKLPPLPTVDKVDLNRYTGLWYQFAYFPNSFQPRDAKLTTAEYTLSPKGYIIVKNSAFRDSDGKQLKKDIFGKAFITDKTTNAKLKVQFFWPFRGNYWIVLLDDQDYNWAVVSEPHRKYLWILTRTPELDKDFYATLLQRIKDLNINTNKLVVTGRFSQE